MKKTLPMLSIISAFCCALAILVQIFPVITGSDYDVADVIAYISEFISCITLILWLILGNRKHKIIAVVSVMSETLLLTNGIFHNFIPYHTINGCGALIVPLIANILLVVCSDK